MKNYEIKRRGHRARFRVKGHLFRHRAWFEGNLLPFVRARAHVRALMTLKSCAVGMRNAMPRNHLKEYGADENICHILCDESSKFLV